jgi:ABC-type dipeptide/oligopeptide/nickel transport system permease component
VLTYVIRRLLYGSAVLFAASTLVFWGLSLVTSPIGFLRMQPILSSAVVTETIFALDGMGLYFITQLNAGDPYPVMAFLMVPAVFVVTLNLLANLAYGWFDPQVRLG